jgi:hypothetical protein
MRSDESEVCGGVPIKFTSSEIINSPEEVDGEW